MTLEADPHPVGGDFWGLYLAVEQEDGFLEEHATTTATQDGEWHWQRQSRPGGSMDKSDLNCCQHLPSDCESAIVSMVDDQLDLATYFSYRAIVQGSTTTFMAELLYFKNPESGLWSIHSWDLDLTWAE
jgi:hypothetical protein